MRSVAIPVAMLAKRPRCWLEGVRAAWAMRRRGWWRRPPFVPVADPDYLSWRLATAYGDPREPDPSDIESFLSWRRDLRKAR